MKKPRITTPKLGNPNARNGAPLGFKVNENERRVIEAKAGRYAGGNMSAYLRHAALNYEPGEK